MDLTLEDILETACPSDILEDGYKLIIIETHCVDHWIEAKRLAPGKYDIRKHTLK